MVPWRVGADFIGRNSVGAALSAKLSPANPLRKVLVVSIVARLFVTCKLNAVLPVTCPVLFHSSEVCGSRLVGFLVAGRQVTSIGLSLMPVSRKYDVDCAEL